MKKMNLQVVGLDPFSAIESLHTGDFVIATCHHHLAVDDGQTMIAPACVQGTDVPPGVDVWCVELH